MTVKSSVSLTDEQHAFELIFDHLFQVITLCCLSWSIAVSA